MEITYLENFFLSKSYDISIVKPAKEITESNEESPNSVENYQIYSKNTNESLEECRRV